MRAWLLAAAAIVHAIAAAAFAAPASAASALPAAASGASARGAPRAAAEAYSAAYVSQDAPPFIELFAPVAVSVTMRNTGTAPWISAEGDVFLATQRPQDNYFWCIQGNPHGIYSGNRVLLPHDVAPGQEVRFDFIVKPLSCGFTATAPFRFRMLSQTHGTFGEETPDPGSVISTASEFVSQQVPGIAPAGARIPVTVVFRNTSTTAWRPADGYALVSASPTGNTRWGVASIALASDVEPQAVASFSFVVTMPAVPETYEFQWQMKRASGPFGPLSPATPIEVVTPGPPNFQGLWWASPPASEAGWGLGLAHQSDVIFATWFSYDANGDGLWLSMTASQTLGGAYTGALVQTTGPPFDVQPFPSNPVPGRSVGNGTLAFAADGRGTFSYVLNGVAQSKAIERQAFGLLPTCTFALETDLRSATNYQDLWWAAPAGSQAGWGLSIAHQNDTIFAVWFTYDRDGSPMWLAFTAPKTAERTYGGTLYRTTGPPFDAVPFDPARVVATPVGPASLTFTNGNAGTFAWSVDGITGSTPITRQIFQSPGTICQ